MDFTKYTEQNVSIFSGDPHTSFTCDTDGQHAYEVLICELTPEAVKRSQSLAWLFVFSIFFYCFCSGNTALFLLSFFAVGLYGPIAQQFANKFAVRTTVVISPNAFKVLRGDVLDVYDRTVRHSFAMLEHDKARDERESHQARIARAQLRKEVVRPQRIYDDSFHISFMYYGQRHDVATVYNKQRADAVLARLQACDAVMDGQLKMGDAPATSPSAQWSDQTTNLPQAGDLP